MDPEIAASFPGGSPELFLKELEMEASSHQGRETPIQFLKRIPDTTGLNFLTDENDDFADFGKRYSSYPSSRGYKQVWKLTWYISEKN